MSFLLAFTVLAQQPVPIFRDLTIAGSRMTFSRDDRPGKIAVELNDLLPEHVGLLKAQQSLGEVSISMSRPPFREEYLPLLQDVKMMGFRFTGPLTDKGLAALKGHKELEAVSLLATSITDEGIDTFNTLPKLKSLEIVRASVTDKGLETIATMKSLKSLSLISCTRITDEGVGKLTQIESLESLSLHGDLTRSVVRPICTLKRLTKLQLVDIKLTAEDLSDLSALSKLETLRLVRCDIDEKSAKHLLRFPSLSSLGITNNPITEEGVRVIEQIKNLKSLTVSSTGVEAKDLSQLKDRRPELKITILPTSSR